MNTDVQFQAVALTPFEWHNLLRDLEELMRICNRHNGQTKSLYERIGSQLHEEPVTVNLISK